MGGRARRLRRELWPVLGRALRGLLAARWHGRRWHAPVLPGQATCSFWDSMGCNTRAGGHDIVLRLIRLLVDPRSRQLFFGVWDVAGVRCLREAEGFSP